MMTTRVLWPWCEEAQLDRLALPGPCGVADSIDPVGPSLSADHVLGSDQRTDLIAGNIAGMVDPGGLF